MTSRLTSCMTSCVLLKLRAATGLWATLAAGVLTLVAAMATTAQQPTCATSDFDCDGRPDLLWRNVGTTTVGRNGVWLLSGITYRAWAELPAEPNLSWEVGGTGDFNGDGRTDIVWRNRTSGLNRVWLLVGTTRTATVQIPPDSDTRWKIVGVADFNGDRKPDIVWRNHSTGANRVWLMNGTTRTATLELPPESDTAWQIGGVADFSGDGRPDIVWRKSGGDVRLWILDGTQLVDAPDLPKVIDANWQIQAARDLSSDGRAEVLWRNRASGENAVWFLESTTVRSTAHLPVVSPTIPVDRPASFGLSDNPLTQGSNMIWIYE